jgi:hypothetical protein
MQESSMTKWFGPVVLALALIFAISAIESAAAGTSLMALRQQATSQQAISQQSISQQAISDATDIGSRRQHRRLLHGDATGPNYRPTYYDRPQYYRPYPYNVPAPFVFGFGFGPWW